MRTVAIIAGSLLAVTAGAPAKEYQLRGITMAGRLPGPEAFVHDSSGKPGSKLSVKRFLNHEFDVADLEGEDIVITSAADPASKDDPELVVGTGRLPTGSDSAILLFVPGAESGDVDAVILDDSAKAFPPGSFLLVNRCEDPLKIVLIDKDFWVEPLATTVIAEPPAGENTGMLKMEGFRKRGDDELSRFVTTRWTDPGEKREIMVATANPRSGRIEIRGIKDITTPE